MIFDELMVILFEQVRTNNVCIFKEILNSKFFTGHMRKYKIETIQLQQHRIQCVGL